MTSRSNLNAGGSPRWQLCRLAVAVVAACCAVSGVVSHAHQPPAGGESASKALEKPVGQSPAAETGAAKPDPAGARIPYVGPDTYILLDAKGRPQPMPGMTYEDFLAAWKRLNQPSAPEGLPSYAIEELTFRGRVVGQRAELDCRITVRLMGSGAASIPLGLVGAIVQGEPKFSAVAAGAGGEAADVDKRQPDAEPEFLTSDPEHGGYIARFQGQAGARRSLSLSLVVPLTHDGVETSLPINCPRAVSSQLELELESRIGEARVNTGALVSQAENGQGGTSVKVAGLSGVFRLTWQNPAKDVSAVTSVLNALGTIHATLDGRGIRSDARLTVRSYGGFFDQFRVRLPAGAQLVQTRPEAAQAPNVPYHIRLEGGSSSPGAKNGDGRQVVVVELTEKQPGPVVVDLATEHVASAEGANRTVDIGGFEVLGAVRQFGDVALSVADDWQARWEVGSYVRQVDPSELDTSLQTFNPTAAFQYDRQPWSLNLRLARRQLRVHVTPKFELECLPEEARLTVKLNYQVFGARAFEFRVALNGWELTGDPVESASLVDTERVSVTPEGTLLLPLVQASTRRAEVSFSLRRVLDRGAAKLQLPLPVPAADSIGTGELLVRAAPEVNLLPDLPSSTGLTAAAEAQGSYSPPSDGTAELRYRTLLPAAVFVADRTTRTRDVATQVTTQIELAEGAARIEQRFDYIVRFEPVSEATFEVVKDFPVNAADMDIALVVGGDGVSKENEQAIPLHISSSDEIGTSATDGSARRLRVPLPRPLLGTFSVWVRYKTALPAPGKDGQNWLAPLARATEGQPGANTVTVRAVDGLAVVLDDRVANQAWKAAAAAEKAGDSGGLSFVAEHPATILPLTLRAASPKPPATTIVERAWLQTWLSHGIRQDRAAFRIRTAGNVATIELPPEATGAETEVLVNHLPARVQSQAPGRVVVQLAAETKAGPGDAATPLAAHTVELRSRQSYRPSLVTLHQLTPPQIEGATNLSQIYWHIVLPGDEHVIGEPVQLSSASEWQWLGVFWGHRPLKTQAELEEWSGASPQLAPTAGQNQYLYSGIVPVASIELTTAPRWLIVLTASAAVLAIAVVGMYVPRAQRRWLLAGLAAAITIAAISYPGAALLLAQASLVGLLLAGLSLIISRIVRRPPIYRAAPIVSPSSQRMATPRSEPIVISPLVSSASTAPTATHRAPES